MDYDVENEIAFGLVGTCDKSFFYEKKLYEIMHSDFLQMLLIHFANSVTDSILVTSKPKRELDDFKFAFNFGVKN